MKLQVECVVVNIKLLARQSFKLYSFPSSYVIKNYRKYKDNIVPNMFKLIVWVVSHIISVNKTKTSISILLRDSSDCSLEIVQRSSHPQVNDCPSYTFQTN